MASRKKNKYIELWMESRFCTLLPFAGFTFGALRDKGVIDRQFFVSKNEIKIVRRVNRVINIRGVW